MRHERYFRMGTLFQRKQKWYCWKDTLQLHPDSVGYLQYPFTKITHNTKNTAKKSVQDFYLAVFSIILCKYRVPSCLEHFRRLLFLWNEWWYKTGHFLSINSPCLLMNRMQLSTTRGMACEESCTQTKKESSQSAEWWQERSYFHTVNFNFILSWNTNSNIPEEQYLRLEGGMGWWGSPDVHCRACLYSEEGSTLTYLTHPKPCRNRQNYTQ